MADILINNHCTHISTLNKKRALVASTSRNDVLVTSYTADFNSTILTLRKDKNFYWHT